MDCGECTGRQVEELTAFVTALQRVMACEMQNARSALFAFRAFTFCLAVCLKGLVSLPFEGNSKDFLTISILIYYPLTVRYAVAEDGCYYSG